mmetsp:Transcript_12641/g.20427  ORF Transcript_12641/g.20427 Transcript_12641/m.20427 type:complete len:591 (+) Transcript_12641:69-1841(+)
MLVAALRWAAIGFVARCLHGNPVTYEKALLCISPNDESSCLRTHTELKDGKVDVASFYTKDFDKIELHEKNFKWDIVMRNVDTDLVGIVKNNYLGRCLQEGHIDMLDDDCNSEDLRLSPLNGNSYQLRTSDNTRCISAMRGEQDTSLFIVEDCNTAAPWYIREYKKLETLAPSTSFPTRQPVVDPKTAYPTEFPTPAPTGAHIVFQNKLVMLKAGSDRSHTFLGLGISPGDHAHADDFSEHATDLKLQLKSFTRNQLKDDLHERKMIWNLHANGLFQPTTSDNLMLASRHHIERGYSPTAWRKSGSISKYAYLYLKSVITPRGYNNSAHFGRRAQWEFVEHKGLGYRLRLSLPRSGEHLCATVAECDEAQLKCRPNAQSPACEEICNTHTIRGPGFVAGAYVKPMICNDAYNEAQIFILRDADEHISMPPTNEGVKPSWPTRTPTVFPTAPTPDNGGVESSDEGGLSIGMIFLILLLILLFFSLLFVFFKRRERKHSPTMYAARDEEDFDDADDQDMYSSFSTPLTDKTRGHQLPDRPMDSSSSSGLPVTSESMDLSESLHEKMIKNKRSSDFDNISTLEQEMGSFVARV